MSIPNVRRSVSEPLQLERQSIQNINPTANTYARDNWRNVSTSSSMPMNHAQTGMTHNSGSHSMMWQQQQGGRGSLNTRTRQPPPGYGNAPLHSQLRQEVPLVRTQIGNGFNIDNTNSNLVMGTGDPNLGGTNSINSNTNVVLNNNFNNSMIDGSNSMPHHDLSLGRVGNNLSTSSWDDNVSKTLVNGQRPNISNNSSNSNWSLTGGSNVW